jgi:hypothetical protein
MDDRPRKDRLIQTRVPQDLESTLKDEARKRRLSVSHLIRNVLEDTFSLVDNVVTEVDRVVTDSVEMAQTLKRDAQRLAATARGHTAHRDVRRHGHGERQPGGESAAFIDTQGVTVERAAEPEPAVSAAPQGLAAAALADVYGFQELVLNRPASCANCGTTIARGARAHLGMTDKPELPRVWVCQRCLDLISG